MDDETAFLHGILSEPGDAARPLVFADWLEEQGRWPEARNDERGCGHDFPHCHRICDLRLRGAPFRVLRCQACGERLRAVRITEGVFGQHPGVPLWLRGEGLRRWIADELDGLTTERDERADGASDWEQYRAASDLT
jgi:uncharacterized protein (TIGR02996 family)